MMEQVYIFFTGDGLSVFIFDLGAVHNVDKIQIWRYYRDGRTYHDTKVEVSKDMTYLDYYF